MADAGDSVVACAWAGELPGLVLVRVEEGIVVLLVVGW